MVWKGCSMTYMFTVSCLKLNIISNGMIPKLQNSFNALNKGVNSVKIAGSSLDKINMKNTLVTN